MANIEENLYRIVTTAPAIIALMSDRLYPVVLPQGVTMPAASYRQISDVPYVTHSHPNGLERTRYEFNVEADQWSEAKNLADALITVLSGYRRGAADTVRIDGIWLMNRFQDYDDNTGIHREILDFRVYHES